MINNEFFLYGDQNVQVPAHLNFGKYMLDRLRKMNNEIALVNASTEETLTYKDLTQSAVNLSVSLLKLGVKKGDVVAVGAEKRNDFIPTVLGILFTGATYTPYDLHSGRAVLKHKMSITEPEYFICSKLFWDMYKDILQSFDCIKTFISLDDEDQFAVPVKCLISNQINVANFEPVSVTGQTDTAFILYSSGTTGMPKGVLLSHLNCILNSLPDDFKDEVLQTVFVYGEWYHNYDTFMTYKFLSVGRKIVYVTKITPETLYTCIEDYKVNIAMLVPSQINDIAHNPEIEKYSFKNLKILYSRSAPLHKKTIDNVKSRFPSLSVLQGYGMTEAGELTSESWGQKGLKTGSVGKASPGITLKIVDVETRKPLGTNERGEICVKGPILMKGYIGTDISVYLDEDGFLKTGDLGYYDEDEYFYIVDRIKEIIVYDGYKIAPLELETILLLHPGVREAGVVGKPVPTFGEEPTAFVVKQPGYELTEKDLVEYVAAEVPPFMRLIGGVRFIKEIPRNPRGKILRRRLRELLNE